MNDRQLVEQVIHHGDKRCFAEIVKRYSGMVFSKTLGIVRREELAREVCQQAFIKAYTRLAYWRTDSLGPWLASIAMHTALDILEQERRRRALSIDSIVDMASEEGYSEEREQLLQRMEQAISHLPDGDREIVELHYFRQMKTDDIAKKTGLSHSNVLVKLHRIREKLRKELAKQ